LIGILEPPGGARRRHALGATVLVGLLALAMAVSPSGPAYGIPFALAAIAGLWLPGWHALPGRSFWTALGIFLLLVFLANALWTPGQALVWGGWTLPVTHEGVEFGWQTAARLPAILLLFRGWFVAVDPWEASQWLARGLRSMGLSASRAEEVALSLHLALRAVPAFAIECRRLTLQRALRRGWPGPGTPARERARRLRLGLRDWPSVLVPLVLLALQRAEHVSLALAARFAGSGPATPRVVRRLAPGEGLAVAGASVLLVATVLLRWWP
jgi:energy-coupling factor transporter transmembrane protein EcfT